MRHFAIGAMAAAAFALTAAAVDGVLEWPHGREAELRSPDGRHVVYGEPYREGVREGPELWLRHRGRADRKRLLTLSRTAAVWWFPDSRNFVVIDRESSSGSNSYVYDAEGAVVLDMGAAVLRQDPKLQALARGHFYVEAERPLDGDTAQLAVFGHTDVPPVRSFRFVYAIDRGGRVR